MKTATSIAMVGRFWEYALVLDDGLEHQHQHVPSLTRSGFQSACSDDRAPCAVRLPVVESQFFSSQSHLSSAFVYGHFLALGRELCLTLCYCNLDANTGVLAYSHRSHDQSQSCFRFSVAFTWVDVLAALHILLSIAEMTAVFPWPSCRKTLCVSCLKASMTSSDYVS
jgi:hypothetical protein